jgi:hypothetical protein
MHTLLAVIADRVGVAASAQEYQKAPDPIRRPPWITGEETPRGARPETPEGSGFKRAINVLAGSARRVIGS